MLMVYDQFGSIPEKMHMFYSQAFETLYLKHDATKGGYRREMFTSLSSDEFQQVLAAFSALTFFAGKLRVTDHEAHEMLSTARKIMPSQLEFSTEDYLSDLLRSVCLLLQDGLEYTFTHRSFQEFYAAKFIVSSSSENRRRLLDRLCGGDRIDNVFRLAWDIDQRSIEDDYVLVRLTQIAEQTHFATSTPRVAYMRYFALVFESILIEPPANIAFRISNGLFYNLVHEVSALYGSDTPPDSTWGNRTEVEAFRMQLSLSAVTRTTPPSGTGDVVSTKQLLQEPNLLKLILQMCPSVEWEYMEAMRVWHHLQGKKRSRENAIEELLLKRKGRGGRDRG
jgi:hypothetical protein